MPRTAASRTYPAHAIVLRTRPLGEKDRILTLLSPEHGRISAVAKGARGTKSKLAAVAQPFVAARFLLVKGRTLDIVSQAEIENAHFHLAGDLLKTAWASYACELADTLPEDFPDEEGFQIMRVVLDSLDAAPSATGADAAGAWFEANWLRHQGYSPTIGRCVSCGQKIPVPEETSGKISYSPTLGGTLCRNCAPEDSGRLEVSPAALRAFHRLERSRRPPVNLAEPPWDLPPFALRELINCLHRTLREHTGIKLRTRQFLDEVRSAEAVS